MHRTPQGWTKRDETLVLELKCPDFMRTLALLNSVADIAESLNHHPDIGIRNYNELIVSTTTHSKGGLTDKDYTLAEEINDLINYQDQKHAIEVNGRG
ncbi:4a-hydroxytetrahydrobiopterin dehydratase [Candidatus Saccharibacteria bacterium]|nr:4a-hydroxytetrahydrobiopterin dehydratase [Candidatus Saccharibacteria bacterium]